MNRTVACKMTSSKKRLMRSVPRAGGLRPIAHGFAVLIGTTLPLACTVAPSPQMENPFVGDWLTAEDASITIRPDTIVQTPAGRREHDARQKYLPRRIPVYLRHQEP